MQQKHRNSDIWRIVCPMLWSDYFHTYLPPNVSSWWSQSRVLAASYCHAWWRLQSDTLWVKFIRLWLHLFSHQFWLNLTHHLFQYLKWFCQVCLSVPSVSLCWASGPHLALVNLWVGLLGVCCDFRGVGLKGQQPRAADTTASVRLI